MAKKETLPEPSNEFMDALCHAGSIVVDCDLCGRTHFSSIATGYNEGELEDLMAKHNADPDKYIIYNDDDSISYGNLDGKQIVFRCPCNLASNYERLFWSSRHIISDYFSKRAKKIKSFADETSKLAKDVKDAVNSVK